MPRQRNENAEKPTDAHVLSHEDYAEEAESAGRAEAWPQAAALWRRAADVLRATGGHDTQTFDLYARYHAAADECDRKDRLEQVLADIARAKLQIPTLKTRHSDAADFHELAVWQIRRALLAAYEAGRADAK